MSDLLDQMVAWWRYSDQVAENPFVGGAFRRCADELSAAKPAIVREIQAEATATLLHNEIVALAPDPTWLAREILRARIEEAKWWNTIGIIKPEAYGRISDLGRQLAELAQENKGI